MESGARTDRAGRPPRIGRRRRMRPSIDEVGERPDFWVLLLRVRCVAAVALPLALVAFPSFGGSRHLLAVLAGAAGTTSNLVLLRRVRRGLPIRGPLAATDTVSVLSVIAFVPGAYAPGAVLLTSMAALYVFWFGGERAVRLLAPTTVALLALGWYHRPQLWLPVWLAWTVTTVLGAVPISRLAALSNELRNRYDDMVNGIDAVVWESHGPSADATYMSERVADLLGYEPDELMAFSDLLDKVAPADRPLVVESRRRAAAGERVDLEYRLHDAQGRTRRLHERITVATEPDRRSLHRRRGVIVDETARWEAERSVRSYTDFVENLPIPLAILRLDDVEDPSSIRVVVGNPAAAELVGRRPDDVVGRRVVELLPLSDLFLESLADVAREEEILQRPYLRLEHLDAVFAMRAVPLPDRCIGLMLEDVTATANRSRSLQHQATHDHLTGLPNRAMFDDRLSRALERSAGDGEGVAVLLLDLNQFKEVNDTLGHEMGDLLLMELASRLSNELRYCDTVARLGGDEFAILLAGAGQEASDRVGRRVVELCEEPFEIEGFRLQIGASVGIARAPEHAQDARTLVRLADRAMYRAKDAGGGVVTYSPLQDEEGITRFSLLEDLRAAVTSEELLVHYQPRVELATDRIVGVEALVRWDHPRRGLLTPSEFLELAEVSGEIDALTRAVVARSTAELSREARTRRLELGINLSSRSLRHPSLVDWVDSMLDRRALDPSAICFEINEGELMEDPARAREALTGLSGLGVRLCVDDFGTGGSSVNLLSELPLHQVKLDPRLTSTVRHDPTVVQSVIALCHELDLHVVAEGVEDGPTLEALRELGCDSAQGFHLALPMPVKALVELVERSGGAPTAPLAGDGSELQPH